MVSLGCKRSDCCYFMIAYKSYIAPFQGLPTHCPLPLGEGIVCFARHFPRALPWAIFLRAVGAEKVKFISVIGLAVG